MLRVPVLALRTTDPVLLKLPDARLIVWFVVELLVSVPALLKVFVPEPYQIG